MCYWRHTWWVYVENEVSSGKMISKILIKTHLRDPGKHCTNQVCNTFSLCTNQLKFATVPLYIIEKYKFFRGFKKKKKKHWTGCFLMWISVICSDSSRVVINTREHRTVKIQLQITRLWAKHRYKLTSYDTCGSVQALRGLDHLLVGITTIKNTIFTFWCCRYVDVLFPLKTSIYSEVPVWPLSTEQQFGMHEACEISHKAAIKQSVWLWNCL